MPDISRLTTALADRYLIERELGAGGMATVYLARDLKHSRNVAIKVLRPELAAVIGADRFLAEIKTTANLQHPHILALHDSGTVDGTVFYVMPYVAGESLRDRLARDAQLPVADAVRIATEVAGALDYAHRHDVIHRDIKPENILLHDGQALVADFGIALAASRTEGSTRMTETGMSLGTPHYMSPEQAMGERTLDARTDVYALGCVLYEMLTGEPPFSGPTAQSIVAKVMSSAPQPVLALRKSVPPHVAATTEQAIEKLPADRFATAAAFAAALANPMATAARVNVTPASAISRRWIVNAAAGGVLLAAGAFALGLLVRGPAVTAEDGVVRASILLEDSVLVRSISNARLAMTADGRRIAFVGADGEDNRLWIRELDGETSRVLPDTKGAFAPFFSPDGESVAFFVSVSGGTALRVVSAAGGAARTVLSDSLANFGGGDWGDDGQIYFTRSNRGLGRVSPAGGVVTQLSMPDTAGGVKEHDYPDVLPGSTHAVVMLWRGSIGTNHVGLINLKTGAVTDLVEGSYVRYVEPGLLLIGGAAGNVSVVPLDLKAERTTGIPKVLLQNVQWDDANGTSQFAVTANRLVYQRESGTSGTLVWVDRMGQRTVVDSTLTQVGTSVALSPDGRQIAFLGSYDGDEGIWLKDLGTGSLSRMSFDVLGADRPAWTADGRSVAYLGNLGGRRLPWIRRADGSAAAERAMKGDTNLDELVFERTGRYIISRSEGSSSGSRYLLVSEAGEAPRILLRSPYDHYAVTLSPDGRWLAYTSSESGNAEVYVRPFPNVDSARFIISAGGGAEPLWARDGKELFFRNARGAMHAVPVTTGDRFTHRSPQLLFNTSGLGFQEYYRAYDVHPDGQQFLMVTTGGTDAKDLSVILNLRAELERLRLQSN